MEGHCSAGQSPQWAVVTMEEEEEEEEEAVRQIPTETPSIPTLPILVLPNAV